MTDTTQEDVRLVKCCCDRDWFGPHQQGCPAYDPNEWADWYKAQLTAYQSLGSPEYLAALVGPVVACIERGLVFGYHPGFHHAESDPRRDVYVPQETGWWVRSMGDDGSGVESHPTLAEALAAHDNAERLREEGQHG